MPLRQKLILKVATAIGIGLTVTNTLPTMASSIDRTQLAQVSQSRAPLADGIYLYGQSTQAEQIGQEYIVFKVRQGKVIGAVYMPRSEFNCFSGAIESNHIKLSIVDPYDGTAYPHQIALETLAPIASTGQLPREVGLEGYNQISRLSDNDRRILNVCLKQ
ncbi:hypothetical protein HC931_12155 [Candidatus Gracilibacteria bacterium]|nr:hypothetical protein [Candidatus Gracilibacteria bacterium]NJM88573.1 hypothetical protein [Hydrococcus sp. RU_2_2]NJP20502.1 hypothetical protein [Hydrococcus sp. CRU_1_1]